MIRTYRVTSLPTYPPDVPTYSLPCENLIVAGKPGIFLHGGCKWLTTRATGWD